jgi:DNA-binding response OmpR family regulator
MSQKSPSIAEKKIDLLVVDDDLALSSLMTEFFGNEEFRITTAATGEEAIEIVSASLFSLVILDVMLPGIDGFTVLRRLRELTDTPVLMLTTRGATSDRVQGLDLGADDYLAKPFQPEELLARIRSVLRRTEPRLGRQRYMRIGDLELDEPGRRFRRDLVEIELTGAEFSLLHLLISKPGEVFPREFLVGKIFERPLSVFDRSIDSLVSNLRKKLGPHKDGSERLQSVRGVGYAYVKKAELP